MEITSKYIKILDSWGGRTANDVLKDRKGYYVLMNGRDHKPTKVYLPKEPYISKEELLKTNI